MQSTHELSKHILWLCKSAPSNDDPEMINAISNRISWHIDDALKLIKNIKETSVNEQDRVNRIIELEHKFDIPKTHLL